MIWSILFWTALAGVVLAMGGWHFLLVTAFMYSILYVIEYKSN